MPHALARWLCHRRLPQLINISIRCFRHSNKLTRRAQQYYSSADVVLLHDSLDSTGDGYPRNCDQVMSACVPDIWERVHFGVYTQCTAARAPLVLGDPGRLEFIVFCHLKSLFCDVGCENIVCMAVVHLGWSVVINLWQVMK
jgi:hypothetical protein